MIVDTMYVKGLSVTKIFTFAAAHHLPNYNGKCADHHGHTWKLFVSVKLKPDSFGAEAGMIVDFSILKNLVNKYIIDILDHSDLNNCCNNPTAENILLWIKEQLEITFKHSSYYLSKLQLWESEDSFVEGEWEET
jgi:6-pyruvoyltetrahydropterin/6-carboxytetrahydropterin synthase